jgi:hypothetical protein
MIGLLLGIIKISTEFAFVENLKPETSTEKYIMIIGLVVMTFIVLAVHELGHLMTGLLNGFRFELFVVGPLGIKRENDQVKVYLNKNIGYYGGIAATSPVDDDTDHAKKFAKILLAGPITSALFAIICFAMAYLVGKPLGIIFYIGGAMSMAIFVATTIPARTGMFFTDRKRYQRLMNPGKDREVELAMLKIVAKYSKENSYKNVDKQDINVLTSDEIPFIKFYGLFNLLCYQLEIDGAVDEETSRAYENLSNNISNSVVSAFNKELEKFKSQLETQPDKV